MSIQHPPISVGVFFVTILQNLTNNVLAKIVGGGICFWARGIMLLLNKGVDAVWRARSW